MIQIGVVGSRGFDNFDLLTSILNFLIEDYESTIIVSGGAKGADSMAEIYASEMKLSTLIYEADWERFGKRAGFIRNKLIVDNSDFIVAFWDGKSKGTKHTIDLATNAGKEVIIIRYKNYVRDYL